MLRRPAPPMPVISLAVGAIAVAAPAVLLILDLSNPYSWSVSRLRQSRSNRSLAVIGKE